ncbi:MAG TPA: hypothetical protein VHX61_11065 [Rhizomicrobium sp.]|jgi:hypothetical protein|nr:hypothetical protein [Rhizomicrobium sp.]
MPNLSRQGNTEVITKVVDEYQHLATLRELKASVGIGEPGGGDLDSMRQREGEQFRTRLDVSCRHRTVVSGYSLRGSLAASRGSVLLTAHGADCSAPISAM